MALDSMGALHVGKTMDLYIYALTPHSITGAYTLLIPVLMKETRPDVILIRIARKMRKETGDARFQARCEDTRASFGKLLWISWTRPFCKWCHEVRDTQLKQYVQIYFLRSLWSGPSA
jgi:hypothetical protein